MEIYIDGASRGNQFGSGKRKGRIAVVMKGNRLVEDVGDVTNNQAEYLALIKALKILRERKIKKARIYSDSELLVRQISGEYRVKNPNIRPLHSKVMNLLVGMDVSVNWIPRERNPAGRLLEV